MTKEKKKRSSKDVKSNSSEGKSKKQEFSKGSAQKEKKADYRERKEKLLNFMQAAGSWVLPRTIAEQIAEESHCSIRQIYKDRLKIIKSVPVPRVKEVAGKFLISWDFAMLQANALMRSEDYVNKAKGVDLFFKSIDVFTRFMESFGFKEKVADDLNLHGSLSGHGEESLMKILDKYIKN